MASVKTPGKKGRGIVFNKKPSTFKKVTDNSRPKNFSSISMNKTASSVPSQSEIKMKSSKVAQIKKIDEGKKSSKQKSSSQNLPKSKKEKSPEEKQNKEKLIYHNAIKSTVKVLNDIEARNERKNAQKDDLQKMSNLGGEAFLSQSTERFRSNKEFKKKSRAKETDKKKKALKIEEPKPEAKKTKNKTTVARKESQKRTIDTPLKQNIIKKSTDEKVKPKKRHRIVMRSIRLKNSRS